LALNGATSSFNVTTLDSNITISKFDPNNGISYTVNGNGSQTFSVNALPVSDISVNIDGTPATQGNGWSYYSNDEITVTGATSKVVITFL
jgi:hypothetical protein